MSKPSNTKTLLLKILEQPQIVSLIQNLPAPLLTKLIQHVGLEDSGEIVALATTEQIEKIFDEDLWKNAEPGKEEIFDAERFTIWLEILNEMGPKYTAEKLIEMDADFICMAFSQQILVINIDTLAIQISENETHDFKIGLLEKALENKMGQEFGEYWVLAKQHDGWDTILQILLSLDQDHREYFVRLMDQLNLASDNYIEDNGGLYEVLTHAEKLESDMSYAREHRREEQGYVAPLSASHFLTLTADATLEEIANAKGQDPITKSYFKNYETRVVEIQETLEQKPVAEFVQLLQDAEILPVEEPLLLTAAEGQEPKHPLVTKALLDLANQSPKLHDQRMHELNYLANILVSGKEFEGRRYRPNEAAEEVLTICEEGLGYLKSNLKKNDLIKVFRIGWKLREGKK